MTIAEYRTQITRTLPDLGKVLFSAEVQMPLEMQIVISNKLNYNHMASGLATEVGELVECVGTDFKFDVDRVRLGEEIGDLYWYLCNYANMRSIALPETLHVDIPALECLDFLIIKVGELIDIVKKYTAYNREINREKETLAVCDVRLALLVLENVYTLDGGDIRRKNVAKLIKRYPVEFDEYRANYRNLEEERKTLE